MSKAPKKKDVSSSRVTSSPGQTPNKEASSLVTSTSEALGDLRKRVPIWPEWNEAELNAEKWDASKSKDSKGGKGSNTQFFEDPEGKIDLPTSLKVHSWKRPSEYLVKVPMVVENETAFDLTTANEHLLCSELMRWIISEIYILWKACNGRGGTEDKAVSAEMTPSTWKPWEHIYSLCKVVKGHQPLYNPYGKYILKLYWMGAWRKVTIDDTLPFDEENKLLLPASTDQSELWPMLLAKALIKLANTDVIPGNRRELGEFTIIHTLTGWVPEIIPLNTRCVGALWTFLREAIPRFQLKGEGSAHFPEVRNSIVNDCTDSLNSVKNKTPEKQKDSAKKKGKDTDHDRKSHTPVTTSCQPMNSDTAENVMVCASYLPLQILEKTTSELGKMADSSECLRQCGLSQLFSVPVLVTRTRVGPVVALPTPIAIPRWKLIRPRRQHLPTDEPKVPPVVKPEEFIEVVSPFLNFRLKTLATEMRKKQTYNSALASFTEQDESEREIITDSLQSEQADAGEPAEVTAEDKKKDEIPPSDQTASDTQSTPVATPPPVCPSEKPLLQDTWVPLEHFTNCFQTLLVFHKPSAYPHHSQKSQYKSSVSSRLSAIALSSPAAARRSQSPEEKGSYFLVVDSLQPTEILISFSALLHWGENQEERKKELPFRSGVLTAEPFSWKSLKYQLPSLCIHTTACKGAMLKLQPGRHVLCFQMRAVLGSHVHLYSQTPFIFGDEEMVMPVLTKESVCFMEQAVCAARALGRVVSSFSSNSERQAATQALTNTHFPPKSPRAAAGEHMKVFSEAVYEMFSRALDRKLSSWELLAVQALTLQPCLAHAHAHTHTHSHTHTLAPEQAEQPGAWSERSPTEAESRAAVTLQAGCRGYTARRIVKAARPGTKENLNAAKTLQEMWASVETDLKKHAISLLGYMLGESPCCVDLSSCREDEKSRISFSDHSVPLPETPNTWALVFREVFFIPKDTLLVAKVYSPVVSALHVINNDTGEEVPKVFRRVEPHVYKNNQNGYTFVAEAHTGEVPSSRWRMCLIGCRQPLPVPARETPVSSFCVKEFKDYYIPNDKYIICRFSVKASVDVVGTVQFQTSVPYAHLRLTVLDHETTLTSTTGKGHVLIPVFTFRADADSEESQTGEDTLPETDILSEAPSHTHKYIVQVELLHRTWAVSEAEANFIQTLRHAEKNDMRVSPFTTVGADKQDDLTTPTNTDQSSSEGQKSSTPKSTRKAREKEKEKDKEKDKDKEKVVSRVEQALDTSKPHWTLRVVCEQTEAESVCVKRDTERQEQIKALKMAWESADTGRAVKALQSRLQFINKHVRGLTGDRPTDGTDQRESVSQQSPDFTIRQFTPMDYTPYIRHTRSQPLLKDADIEERQQVERSERIQEFRLQRDMVLERRKQEIITRHELKRRQIELYDGIQVCLSEQRQRVLEAREEFHCRLLEEEEQRRKEEVACEAQRQLDLEKNQAQAATTRKSAGKKK